MLQASESFASEASGSGSGACPISGELLRPAVRDAITDALGARVFDIYGSSETKEIAWECRNGGMHVNADVVRLEVLDDASRPVPDGVEGGLVATFLVKRAMPLLRCRTGDRGSLLTETCGCGHPFPLLGVVTGRQADALVLAGGRRVSPYALTCAMERSATSSAIRSPSSSRRGFGTTPCLRPGRRPSSNRPQADPRRAARQGSLRFWNFKV